MKKALIVIISAIYVIAIIIVAFLGSRAEISNETIYTEEIVLRNETFYYPGTTEAQKTQANMVYGVYKRPEESLIDPETGRDSVENLQWNYNWNESKQKFEGKRDYAILIYDTWYVYTLMNKELALETTVLPENATKKDLSYVVTGGNAEGTLAIDNNSGKIIFSVEYESPKQTDIIISTTDGSKSAKTKIQILLVINRYS